MNAHEIRRISENVEKYLDTVIENALDNIAVEMTSKIDGYDGKFCADQTTKEVLDLHDKYVKALTAMLMAEASEDVTEALEDEFDTDFRYYVYDVNDKVISDGFEFEDDAIDFALENQYPVVKLHNYFVDESDKLRPDGDPEVVWNA